MIRASSRLLAKVLLERSWLVATILIAFCAGVTATERSAQNVVSHVDGVFYEGAQPFVLGWACQPGSRDSLDIKISADALNGRFLLAGRADFESDAGVVNVCRDWEGKHRFKLPLPSSMFVKGRDRKVYAEAMPPKGGSSGSPRYVQARVDAPVGVHDAHGAGGTCQARQAHRTAIQRHGSVSSPN